MLEEAKAGCRNVRSRASLRLVGAWNDDGHFCGWISLGDAAALMLAKLGGAR